MAETPEGAHDGGGPKSLPFAYDGGDGDKMICVRGVLEPENKTEPEN